MFIRVVLGLVRKTELAGPSLTDSAVLALGPGVDRSRAGQPKR